MFRKCSILIGLLEFPVAEFCLALVEHLLGMAHDRLLGDLQPQRARWQRALGKDLLDARNELALEKDPAGDETG